MPAGRQQAGSVCQCFGGLPKGEVNTFYTALLPQVARECQALTDACEFLVADRCGGGSGAHGGVEWRGVWGWCRQQGSLSPASVPAC